MIPELAVRLSGCSLYPVLVRWQTIFLVPYYMCMPFLLISCLVSGLPIPWLFFFLETVFVPLTYRLVLVLIGKPLGI